VFKIIESIYFQCSLKHPMENVSDISNFIENGLKRRSVTGTNGNGLRNQIFPSHFKNGAGKCDGNQSKWVMISKFPVTFHFI
jgi:hypothetical protein